MGDDRAVRTTRTKHVVNARALRDFLECFDAEETIAAVYKLLDFAATHPDFGKRGKPNDYDFATADTGLQALAEFLLRTDPGLSARRVPEVRVDDVRGTIELPRAGRFEVPRPKRSLRRARRRVPVRLYVRPAARN